MTKILSGRFAGCRIDGRWSGGAVVKGSGVNHVIGEDLVSYEVVDENHKVGAGVGNAALGAVLLGPVGLLGGLSAAGKARRAVLTWDDGSQSLAEVKESLMHKTLVTIATSNSVRAHAAPAPRATRNVPSTTARKCAVGPCQAMRLPGKSFCADHGPRS